MAIRQNTDVPYKLYIWDNASTDDTRIFLKYLNEIDPEIEICLSEKNVGISKAMNEFIKRFRDYDYLAKVDNDTLVPSGWASELLKVMKEKNLDTISASLVRHYGQTTQEWFGGMRKERYGDKTLYFNHYTSGSGIVFKTDIFRRLGLLFDGICELGTWSYLQRILTSRGGRCAFYDGVWVRQLDMAKEHQKSGDYAEYDQIIKAIREEGNRKWVELGDVEGITKMIQARGGTEKL